MVLFLLSNPLPRRALGLLFDYILKNGKREYLSKAIGLGASINELLGVGLLGSSLAPLLSEALKARLL